jgi:hypothetical protein
MAEREGNVVKPVRMGGECECSIRKLVVGDFVETLNGLFVE